MDVEKLQKLVKEYPEVRELLRDNYSLSVAAMAAQMEVWRVRMDGRLTDFDANHTHAHALLVDRIVILEAQTLLVDRMAKLEDRLDRALKRLAEKFKDEDKTNGD